MTMGNPIFFYSSLSVVLIVNVIILFFLLRKDRFSHDHWLRLDTKLDTSKEQQLDIWKLLQENLQKNMTDTRQQLNTTLKDHASIVAKQLETLTTSTYQHLQQISQHVEKRLNEGFEKTTATFTDIVKRLALIDAAQKKITELSSNVVNLQNILANKQARGVFGEVQLATLIHDVLPESKFAFQYTLTNGKRADCILFLPKPTGNIVIDAKFPLESYQQMNDPDVTSGQQQQAKTKFRADINKHIEAIASKYILPEQTADGAIMFIPAEAVFAEIHAHFPELVAASYRAKVWIVSPTTMMAILTTARAVLKDEATRKQIHIIQEHLRYLAHDFSRFEKRMDNLARHIDQAHNDVDAVHTSAKKITSRFNKIEKAELGEIGSEENPASLDKQSSQTLLNPENETLDDDEIMDNKETKNQETGYELERELETE